MSSLAHRILVVGVGSIGERHLRCFLRTGRAELAFAEVNETLRGQIAERYTGTAFYPSLEAALEFQPTAAVIATPASLHIPQALRLAESGAHLFIEKPLSTGLVDVDRLQEVVHQKRVVANVGYVYRTHPALEAMREAVRSGRFGRPLELVVVSGQHFPTYRPAYASTYYANRATGGGAVQDALTHLLNAGEWLVGPVERLVADAAHATLPNVEVEDTVHLLARQGSVLASYSLNQHQAPDELTISVICEGGTTRFEPPDWRWMTEPGGEWHLEQACELDRDGLFTRQAHTFLDAVEGKCPPACSLADGIQTLRVNLTALRSLETGQWERVTS